MPSCPACGAEVVPPSVECSQCHLSVALFDAVREAVGVEETDPRYSAEVHELLRAVDTDPPKGPSAPSDPPAAVLAYPARFPAPAPPRKEAPEPPSPPALDGLPALPALPSGGPAGLRRQIDDLQHLARSMGIDVADTVERNREAIAVDDRATLERVYRELFVQIAAALAEEYEATIARRNGLAPLVNTASEDVALLGTRSALLAGDLAGASEKLRSVQDRLAHLEEEHATVMILVAEGELLADTIRELGGDPGPALGPLEEGRRMVRDGDPEGAETVLARASVALWAVLYPRLGPELRRVKEGLLARRAAGEDIQEAVEELRRLAMHLKHRNFAATVVCYRRLRDLVDAGAPSPDAPDPGASPVPEPSAAPH